MKKIKSRNPGKNNTAISRKTKAAKEKKKKLADARSSINYFFEVSTAEEEARQLWEILSLALTNKQADPDEIKTDNMLFFYETTKQFFENVETLWQKKILKEKQKIKNIRLKYSGHKHGN